MTALTPLLASELVDPSFGKNCIGCSPRNGKGLHLHFEPRGREVRAEVLLDDSYESYPGMIHGGIVALILDEVTGRAALWHARCFVVTLGIRIRYGAIMRPGGRYVARAEVEAGSTAEQIKVTGVVEDEGGQLVATATSTFAALREDKLHDAAAGLPEATRALAHELCALGHETH
jgi:acyl-coenzyme A thioesterase PaaI-like protein